MTDAARAMFDRDASARLLGIELVELSPGRAVCRMVVRADMLNGYGTVQGGLLVTLADAAFGCACNTGGKVNVAAGADVVWVAPAHEGDVLVATAGERIRYGRSAVSDVTVRRGGDVILEFRGTSRETGR